MNSEIYYLATTIESDTFNLLTNSFKIHLVFHNYHPIPPPETPSLKVEYVLNSK